MKKIFVAISVFALLFPLIGVLGTNISWAQNPSNVWAGKVVKIKGFPTLYYIGSDNKRYVFPNEKAYFSWYNDFSNIVEADANDVANYPLSGNVQYRPGAVLVKIQTDPRVYAVSTNGILRWVKNEGIAKKLYGDKWNLLVDDIPDTFFTNYQVGTAIENDSDFDPNEEEGIALTISENHDKKIREKIKNRAKKQLNFCIKSEKEINKLQKRALRQGIKIEGVAENFLKQCVNGAQQPPVNNPENNKVVICHIPPGNPRAKQTLVVGVPSAKAHLSHGDTFGACSDGTPNDTTAPVISNVIATATAPTLATITWNTNEPSTSKVAYATQSLSAATSTLNISNYSLIMSHAITLTGLAPFTTYYFRAESSDASSNTATSTETTFTTLVLEDTIPPVISAITATSTAPLTMTIGWTTNEPSTSKVVYATQGLATATTTASASDSNLLTSHSLMLTNLATSTQYFFQVESKDEKNNTSISAEGTFLLP